MKVKAPWTPEQMVALNRWQHFDSVHPFTCPNEHKGSRVLIAGFKGWTCRCCDYVQDWAHDFMFEPWPRRSTEPT